MSEASEAPRCPVGVLRSGVDTKWSQLNRILDDDLMIDAAGNRRKLIIFTEPKDTLHYLLDKVRARLGNPEAVEVIHGGVSREEFVPERFVGKRLANLLRERSSRLRGGFVLIPGAEPSLAVGVQTHPRIGGIGLFFLLETPPVRIGERRSRG